MTRAMHNCHPKIEELKWKLINHIVSIALPPDRKAPTTFALARKMGIHRSDVSRLINMKRQSVCEARFSLDRLLSIARHMGIDVEIIIR